MYELQDATRDEMNDGGKAETVRQTGCTYKASEQRPLREGHQAALAKNVVSPVDAREKGFCSLAVHPFRYRAIGSIAESALPLRFWVGVVLSSPDSRSEE